MPYDFQADTRTSRMHMRDEILDLMSRRSFDPQMSEQQYRAALRAIVAFSKRPAEDLWDKYHSPKVDTRAATYASYGY